MNYINNNFLEKNINISYLKTFMMIFSLGVIAAYILAFYTDDGDIMINDHDNLDSNIAIYKLLSDTETFFSPNNYIIENVMNGIPRAALPRERNVISMLYYFFEPIDAYIINESLIRLIAFFGMLALLRKHFLIGLDEDRLGYQVISLGAALTFSLLPYWSNGGVSVAGQPFVLYAFLNIKNRDIRYRNWLILAVFPFYSSLILAGIFVVSMLVVVFIYSWVKDRAMNPFLLLAIGVISILYLFAEYRHLDNMLNPLYISHREEFLARYLTFHQSLARSAGLFFNGQTHAHSIHDVIILPFIFIYASLALINKRFKKISFSQASIFIVASMFVVLVIYGIDKHYGLQWDSAIKLHLSINAAYYYLFVSLVILIFLHLSSERVAVYIMLAVVVITVFGGFEDFQGFKNIKEYFSILSMLKFDRYYFLLPLLWFLLFVVISKIFLEKNKYSIFIISVILLIQCVHSFRHHGVVTKKGLVGLEQYYSQVVYDEVKAYINEPVENYRVMSLGIPPAVAIYNGFYTLDAYLPTYPLEYKHAFRKIIAEEIEKNERSKSQFDNWGSRCVLRMANKENITLNLKQFKKMGGKYFFSRYEIIINDRKNVEFVRYFSSDKSLYNVFLYKVI